MDPSASGRGADYVRRRSAGIEWTQMPLWHDTLSVCEAREGKPAGAGRPLVCVGRRTLSKQRTRNPCRAMRCRWLGHCGIKLLRRSRDNVSTQSVCMSVRGPSLPPSGIIVSCSTRDSQVATAQRGSNYFSFSSFRPPTLRPAGPGAAGADKAVTIVNMAINVAIC